MRAFSVSASPPDGRRVSRLVPFLALLTVLASCAPLNAPLNIDVPSELPLRANDQIFAIQWALQKEPSSVRAVGILTPSSDTEARVTVGLFGVDANGKIVSRGTGYFQSRIAARTIPFEVFLTPTGREADFVLRVLDYRIPGPTNN
jgi:hypothetical protein